jgi:hypothetical protein
MLQHEGLSSVAPLALRRAPREPGWPSRTVARLRWFSLDGRLAAGEDPSGSTLLAAQAAHLTAPRRRELLAAALGGLLLAASERPHLSRVPLDRAALLRNEAALRELAWRVDSPETVYARGLARLELMLGDASGPAFRGDAGELSAEIERVNAELSGVRTDPPPAGSSRGLSVRRLARLRPGSGAARAGDPPGFAGGSFALPDGSWFHGRREAS